jgi:hypothetical protein
MHSHWCILDWGIGVLEYWSVGVLEVRSNKDMGLLRVGCFE